MHSFHLDLRQNPEHKAQLEGIFAALQRGLGRAAQHVAAWRSLSAIWMTDKALAVQQLKVARSLELESHAVCLPRAISKLLCSLSLLDGEQMLAFRSNRQASVRKSLMALHTGKGSSPRCVGVGGADRGVCSAC